jgi:hypothetical protein
MVLMFLSRPFALTLTLTHRDIDCGLQYTVCRLERLTDSWIQHVSPVLMARSDTQRRPIARQSIHIEVISRTSDYQSIHKERALCPKKRKKENTTPLRDATKTQSEGLLIPSHRKSYGIPALQICGPARSVSSRLLY